MTAPPNIDDMSYEALVAALAWQVELGVVDALSETPVDHTALGDTFEKADAWFPKPGGVQMRPPNQHAPTQQAPGQSAPPPRPSAPSNVEAVEAARVAARGASDLEGLRAAMAQYGYCELQKGARSLVFGDGQPQARVMVIGEAPGAEEDKQGKPFVGRAGQLLDRMFAAIGMGRDSPDAQAALYITNILPWRPPQNRDPQPDEIEMMRPFLERHVALVNPDVLVLMGNHACQALLGRKGITRLRGTWAEAIGKPVLPMFHPAYLLRNPIAKREAWADLLALQAKLRG